MDTFYFQTRGIKTQANVLEMVVDQHYRTTNWRRSVDYYKVKVEFINQQGDKQIQWTHLESADKDRFNVAVGSKIPFIYIPGSEKSLIDDKAQSWSEWMVWGALFFPLGILFIGLAIFKKIPGLKS